MLNEVLNTDEEMIMGIPIELLADVVFGLKQICS